MTSKESNKPVFNFEGVFHTEDYLYFYEEVLSDERTDRDVNFLVRELKLDKPLKILDLACGHGRHANKLAELMHRVIGVDINKGFLKIAKEDAKQKRVNPEYIKADMRKISFKEEFDVALLLFTAFGYFNDEDNFNVLKNVAKALKIGGMFCFDTLNRDTLLKCFPPDVVVEKGRDLMIDRRAFDPHTGRLYNKRIMIRDGMRKDASFFVRLYNFTEIKDLLNRAGLEIHKVYENWNAKPFTTESGRMVIVAAKSGKL